MLKKNSQHIRIVKKKLYYKHNTLVLDLHNFFFKHFLEISIILGKNGLRSTPE
jgi:hypothetical protein